MRKIRLSGINIYPIKSISGSSLKESNVGERGLEFDRRWMLIDENNMFLTQRKYREMSLLDLRIDRNHLIVGHRLKNFDEIKIPLKIRDGKLIEATVWNDKVEVEWPKHLADAWFSDALQTSCKLVYMPANSKRQVDPEYVMKTTNTSLSDAYPYLLANTKSLDDVREKCGTDLDMSRFRPNLVVEGNEAFEEDNWKKIKVGECIFEVVKPCARCVITTIDQITGISGKEPLKTLNTYRKLDGKILFGQNMLAASYGSIRVGDEVEIVE